ncbi:hypothetical protein SDRG_15990 [Saprolegnia diclina VS20]|uniref:DUF3668 domain-containing protein n=1 Tax=Saprolegnia diclina (strain VS20) TaxID=1156394 RepID=T0PVA2_SAPDV|nr:hypothetical protein SDRG_15990 [Saprolegnia diclina VS20]EQC26186.1 hypothetical protein SDRG_15990 [Saprolegnia diclina VS20]|eukprot:XP_008620401.1 hypothetical protein SDRG_15990 [Saprolegnia diclina VS20]
MELEIHVRRARNLTFAASSVDPAALELRIQCSVNGDLRSSGSGKRSSSKGFDGYVWRGDAGVLRWHLSLTDFRRLKSMRPTLKIYVFGIGAQVHTLGWFFLDLRTPDTALRWVKILNSKHHGEVYVKSQLAKASVAPAPSTPQALPATAVTTTEPMATEAPECLVVGPIETATDVFLLTVTLVNAREMTAMITKLLQKSSPNEIAAIKSAGFWLAYSLFDVLVQSDAFTSLESASFGLLRGVFRLQSSLGFLREHTLATPLPLFLCTVDRILGRVEMPLRTLAELDLPAHAEGSYPFEPSHATKGTPLGVVDVALDLVLEAPTSVEPEVAVAVEPTPLRSAFYGNIDYLELHHHQHLDTDGGMLELTTSSSDESLRAPMIVAEHRDAVLMWTDGLSWLSPTARDDVTVTVGEVQVHATLLHDVHSAVLYEDDGRAVGTIFYSYTSEVPPPSTLERPGSPLVLVLQILSIKATSHWDTTSTPVHVAFEPSLVETKSGPRLSTSRISLRAKEDVDVEAAKTVFCHVQASQLQRPWQLHLETTAHESIAVATLSLAYLGMLKQSQRCDLCGELLAEDTDHAHDGAPQSVTTFTYCEVYVPAVRPGSDTAAATLHVVATLQDKYPIAPVYPPPLASPRPVVTPRPLQAKPVQQTHHDDAMVATDDVSPTTRVGVVAPGPALRTPDTTNATIACTCAATLAAEKRVLAEKQRELQATHHRRMEALEAEWASREKDRVQTVRVAQHEYMALETELRKTLAELEQRERRLAHAEESARLQSELQKQETEANERRVKRETSATLQSMEAQLERLHVELRAMQGRAERAEARATSLEQDMTTVRAELRKSPEHALRQEVVRCEATIASLEKRLRDMDLEKAKADATQMELVAQVERLTLLLQREKRKQEDEKASEIDKLRLKYRAREERFVLDGDREELRAIKKQLDLLREVSGRDVHPEVTRLQREKDDLMQRGGYAADSPVIVELDRRILAARNTGLRRP